MLTIIRRLAVLIALFGATSAFAQSYTYSIYVDADNNPATGCTVTLPGGTVTGAESVLTATVNAGSPPQVAQVTHSACSGGSFGAPVTAGTAAVEVGAGTGGGTAIELSTTTLSLVAPTATTVRLYVVAQSATGSDVLLTTTGASTGAPILFTVNTPIGPGGVIPAPMIGIPAVILLGMALLLFGSRAARRRLLKRTLIGLAFVSGIAGAAIFNWNGIAPIATDPSGDSTSGETAIDLRALFAAVSGGNLYFRVDVSGNLAVPTSPPVANPVSATVAYDSTNNPVTLNISGGAPASVAVSMAPTHGSAVASGTSISYTPTVGYAGADSFQYTATNSGGTSAPATVTITVSAPTIALNPATLPDGTTGTPYSQTLSASGGAAPYSFTVTSGALPPGLTLNATSGTLTGTPSAANTYNFTITATDSSTGAAAPFTASRAYTVTITASVTPPVANDVSATVTYDSTNNPITLNITGGAPASVAVSTAATHGSAVASGTSITYTPTAGYAGPDSFQYTATNAGGTSAPATVTITVSAPTIALNPATLPGGTTGTLYNQTLSASGGAAPYSFTVTSGALPPGLTLNAASGALTGTPSSANTYNFTITVTDSSTGSAAPFTASRSYTVTIVAASNPPVANNVSATVAYDSTNNPITLNITGGAPVSVAVSTAATHGSAVASGTSITYTPTVGYAGPDSFQYTATNADGTSAPATVTITVSVPTIIVNPATLPGGSVGTAYSQTLSASGGAAPYSFAVTSGALPAGLSLDAATGVLSGTPTTAATANFTVTATDSSTGTGPFTGSRAYTVVVVDNRPLANPDSYTTDVGTPLTIAAPGVLANDILGTPPATVLSYGGGSLGGTVVDHAQGTTASLAGGTFTLNGDGSLSLTAPTTAGTYTVMYRIGNASGTSDSTVTIQVNEAPTILSPASVTFAINVAATPFSITTSGTPTVTSITLTGCTLPTGLNFAYSSGANATISGTPTVAGNVTCVVTASNGVAPDATQNLTVSVTQGPVAVADSATTTTNTTLSVPAASGLLANDTLGNPAATLTSFGGNSLGGTVTTNAAGASVPLAGGTLTVNGDGSFGLATPTQSGEYTFQYRIDNGVGQSDALVTIDVNEAPAITSSNTTAFVVGQNGNFTVTTSGFPKPTLTHTGSLPSGVTFVDNGNGTATISGTPASGSASSYSITITASNGIGSDATQGFTLQVNVPPAITSAATTTFTVGTAGTFTVTATGTPTPTLSESGALPGGITFTPATGVLGGTPAVGSGGSYTITFTAHNGIGTDATQTFTLIVNEAPTITSGISSTFPIGLGSSFTVTTSGYPSGATMVIGEAGALPIGVNLIDNHNGTATLSGTPQANTAGTYNITIGASNGIPPAASQAFTLTVTCPTITLGPASGGTFTASYNTAFTTTFAPSGGTAPYTYAVVGSLPNVVFSGNDLTGIPNNTGSFTFTVKATDVWGCSSPVQSYTLNVNPVAANDNYGSIIGNVVVDAVTAGIAVTSNDQFPAGTGSISPTTLTSANGGSVTITGTGAGLGQFVYDPPVGYSGSDSFQYTLTSNGRSATGTVSFTVAANPIWFINNTAGACPGAPCDGRQSHPFTGTSTIVNDGAAAHPKNADSFFVYTGVGSYSGSLTLRANQDLIGQGATATLTSLTGQTPGVGQTLPTTSGTAPQLTSAANTVVLNTNNLVRGLKLGTTGAGAALFGTNFGGLIASETSLTGTSCTAALNLVQGSGTAAITASFPSIAASGCVNGIALGNTSGTFSVTGDGTNDGSGGLITNTSAAGVNLANTAGVSLTSMSIQSTAQSGVNGSGVNGFSFVNGTINNSGTAGGAGAFWSNIAFNTNPTTAANIVGTLTVTGSTLTNAWYSGIDVQSGSGTLANAVITGNTITSSTSTAASFGYGINLVGTGSAGSVFNLTQAQIANNTVANFPSGGGIQVNIGNASTTGTGAIAGATSGTPISITGNLVHGSSPAVPMNTSAILLSVIGANTGSRTVSNFNVSGNGTVATPLGNTIGTVVLLGCNGFSDMTTTVNNNVIVANHGTLVVANGIGGGAGVAPSGASTPNCNFTVTNNNVSQTSGDGILLVARSAGSSTTKFKVQNNTVAAPIATATVHYGIRIDSGNASSVNENLCLNISGNTTAGSSAGGNTAPGIGLRKQGTVATTNVFGINGLSPSPAGTPNVENYVNGLNSSVSGTFGTNGTALISATSGFTVCSLP